jgi:hypothetical protein
MLAFFTISTTTHKIHKLQQKQSVLKARMQILLNKLKNKQRKTDTRRKILIGAYFLNKFNELKSIMNEFLTRDHDRLLFDLDIIKKDKNTK